MPLAGLICWRESSTGSLSTLTDWSTSHKWKSWESWGCLAWGREGSGESWCAQTPAGRVSRGWGRAPEGPKVKHRRIPLNIRNQSCSGKVTETWHKLNREFVRSPFLEMLKIYPDVVLDSLGGQVGPAEEGGWIRWPPDVPSTFNLSVILFTQSRRVKKELKEKYGRHNKPHTKIFLHSKVFNYPQHYPAMHFRENKCTTSIMQYIFLCLWRMHHHPLNTSNMQIIYTRKNTAMERN